MMNKKMRIKKSVEASEMFFGVRRHFEHRNCGDPVLLILIFCLLFIAPVSAQTQPEYETAPPPLRIMSAEEREHLDKETGVRKRTELALRLMDVRLVQAGTSNSKDQLDDMFSHLGAFHALMEDTLQFLENSDTNKSRVLYNFKRLEIGLRRFTPRLEMLRREMPITHEFYVRTLMIRLRDARTRAVEPFFGDTVIRNDRDS